MSLMLEQREKMTQLIMCGIRRYERSIPNAEERLDECITYNDFLEFVQYEVLGVELENYVIRKALRQEV